MDQSETSAPENRDHVLPDGKWQFDSEVIDVFEEMLRRSIPQYDVMRKAVEIFTPAELAGLISGAGGRLDGGKARPLLRLE